MRFLLYFTFCYGTMLAQTPHRTGLVANGDQFTLNGSPFRILSGAMHYFRIPRQYWRDRLLKAKAAGLNTVETYVPWNLHEEHRGQFNFDGNLDIVEYLTMAQSLGLYVLLRPGPYICAEWEWGGHPAWLMTDPNMKVRTLYSGYTAAIDSYFSHLIPLVTRFQYKQGGPIIAVQVENEYGAYGNDVAYLRWMQRILQQYGINELFFTSDGPTWLQPGAIPGELTVVNFGPFSSAAKDLAELKAFQPNKPLMVGEFWSGWFDHWQQPCHAIWDDKKFGESLKTILTSNASVNFYMFHGGTNFGFMSGANRGQTVTAKSTFQATVTSYDYNAPVSEAGWLTEKFFIIQDSIKKYANPNFTLSPELAELVKKYRLPRRGGETPGIGVGTYSPVGCLSLTDALSLSVPRLGTLTNMVSLGQNVGFIVYRNQFNGAGTLNINAQVYDRLSVVINGKTVQTVLNLKEETYTKLQFSLPDQPTNDVILLVENMGRVNYEIAPKTLDNSFKGLIGTATWNSNAINTWQIYNLEMKPSFISQLKAATNLWQPFYPSTGQVQPSFYSFTVTVPIVQDAFLDFQAWSKGVAFVNNINIGRYWHVGPQKTLYVPGPWLQAGSNSIMLFEVDQCGDAVALMDYPSYGVPCDVSNFGEIPTWLNE